VGRSAYRFFVRKPDVSRQLRRPERRREDDVKLDLKGIGRGMLIGFIWLRIRKGDEPSVFMKISEFIE
jgi:hypothetical protein